jgi:hypothetical protein
MTRTSWLPARQRIAGLAVLLATVTGAAGALGPGGSSPVAGAYVIATLAGLFFPAAITVQVIAGQVLAGCILWGSGQGARSLLLVVPIIASVVATAELLAGVGRLETTPGNDPGDYLRRAGAAAAIGAVAFGAVLLFGELPGPTGLIAIVLASAACAALAILLIAGARDSSPAGS